MLGADKLRETKKNRQEKSMRETSPLLGVGVLKFSWENLRL